MLENDREVTASGPSDLTWRMVETYGEPTQSNRGAKFGLQGGGFGVGLSRVATHELFRLPSAPRIPWGYDLAVSLNTASRSSDHREGRIHGHGHRVVWHLSMLVSHLQSINHENYSASAQPQPLKAKIPHMIVTSDHHKN